MSKLPTPTIDSATGRALMTALQATLSFLIGLILAVWNTPGVPEAIHKFVTTNGPSTLLSMGIPLIIGTSIISFGINYFFRNSVKTY